MYITENIKFVLTKLARSLNFKSCTKLMDFRYFGVGQSVFKEVV